MTRSIGSRIQKVAKGLSAQRAADAFVLSREDPASASSAVHNKAAEFEATVEAMFLMAAMDGDLSPEELSQLAASVEAFASLEGKGARAKVDTPNLLLAMND